MAFVPEGQADSSRHERHEVPGTTPPQKSRSRRVRSDSFRCAHRFETLLVNRATVAFSVDISQVQETVHYIEESETMDRSHVGQKRTRDRHPPDRAIRSRLLPNWPWNRDRSWDRSYVVTQGTQGYDALA